MLKLCMMATMIRDLKNIMKKQGKIYVLRVFARQMGTWVETLSYQLKKLQYLKMSSQEYNNIQFWTWQTEYKDAFRNERLTFTQEKVAQNKTVISA